LVTLLSPETGAALAETIANEIAKPSPAINPVTPRSMFCLPNNSFVKKRV
jgi:hypothetical protein